MNTSSDLWRAARRLRVVLAVALAVVIPVAPRPSLALTWNRVDVVPPSDVYSVQLHGTTVYAGSTDVVYIGAREGTVWAATTSVNPAAAGIETVVPAGGALWAGTFGQGVYRSTNGGTSWDPVNAGLTGLGASDVIEMVEKDGKLYAGTAGAGVFMLDLAAPTTWSEFNFGLPVLTAGTIAALVLHGTTLVAPAGPNGFVYRFPERANAWQEVAILPPIAPGLLSTDLVTAGGDLLVGTSNGAYRSADDAQSWTFAGSGLGQGLEVFLATDGTVFFAGVDFLDNTHRLYRSADRGASWQQIDELPGTFLYALEVAGDRLFAARADGLWWTPLAETGVQAATWSGLKSRFRN